MAEGATTVITVEASDEDSGDTLTYSLSGDDAALFALSDTNVFLLRRQIMRLQVMLIG